jgi:hypothetical protein
VKPFLRKDAPSDRAWIDFVDWYTGSMTDYARFWITETRKNFPTGGIYLCTGGHAPPNHGADFGDQCKVAAEVGGGVRITNEASDYAKNFTYTRWVASAGEQYGAYFSFEPAGNVDANGVVSRVYNATASGAKGLHYYFPNLLSTPAATDNFIRMGGMFQQHKPVVEIGVYYPTTQIKLEEHADTYIYKTFFGATASLRDRFDFNYVSDHMIADGGLARCKALVLVEASVMEAQTWKAIADWVKAGGLLIRADGDGKLRTVDGDETMFDVIQKHLGELGKGALLSIDAKSDSEKFQQFAADVLAKAPQLSAQSRGMVAADGKADGLFVTLLESGELLWFNSTDHEQSTASGIKIPAVSIVSKPAHTAR